MSPDRQTSVSIARRGPRCLGSDPLRTVVWLSGEHDIATCELLSATLEEAAGVGDDDITVDLDGVTFMDASTIGALVDARNNLRELARSLAIRNPSAPARRLFDLCAMTDMIDDCPPTAPPRSATALGSWVSVPVRDRADPSTRHPSTQATSTPSEPDLEPACATARQRAEPAQSIQRRRAPP